MSVHASTWAWSQKVGNPTRKLVLMALADHANGDGKCWPSMAKVAELAECSPRSVRRHIDELAREGLVRKEVRRRRRNGTWASWYLVLNTSKADKGEPAATHDQWPQTTSGHSRPVATDDRDQRPHTAGLQRPHTAAHEPSGVEPSVEPSDSCSSPRKRDELWEAVLATCQWQQSELTKSARGAANRAVKDLRDVGASPAEVGSRAAEYQRRFPQASLTPTALAKNWAELGSPAPAGSNGNGHWNGQGRPPVKWVGDFGGPEQTGAFTP